MGITKDMDVPHWRALVHRFMGNSSFKTSLSFTCNRTLS